jgi:hypothetical protein
VPQAIIEKYYPPCKSLTVSSGVCPQWVASDLSRKAASECSPGKAVGRRWTQIEPQRGERALTSMPSCLSMWGRVGSQFSFVSFAPSGLRCLQLSLRACALGYILAPLRGSVNQLQRKLYLPRRPRGLADDAEATPTQNVGRQPEIHQVEYVEELGAKFHRA